MAAGAVDIRTGVVIRYVPETRKRDATEIGTALERRFQRQAT
ncbi:hypothetical protein ACWEV3_30180 [Saccharopolyspora sp. NPDC003752]